MSLGVITKDILEKIFDSKLPIGEITKVKNRWNIFPLYHPSPASPYGHNKNLVIMTKNKKKINSFFIFYV
jgi:hypothetical protein